MNGYYSIRSRQVKRSLTVVSREMQSILCLEKQILGWALFHVQSFAWWHRRCSNSKQLQLVYIMDGGVGGSWEEVEYVEVSGEKLPTQQKLPQNNQEPFIADFHDQKIILKNTLNL